MAVAIETVRANPYDVEKGAAGRGSGHQLEPRGYPSRPLVGRDKAEE
jgi:hypothetical protein